MPGLGEVLSQQQIATAGQSNAVAQAAQLAAQDDYGVSQGDLTDVWNWLTDPTGAGAGYFPTSDQLEKIANTQPTKKPNYVLYGALALGAFLLLKQA